MLFRSWPGGDLLPAAIGGAVDRSRGGESARLGAVEYGHPLFEAFRAARSGDFTAAQLFGFRMLTPAAGATVLARFDAGAPALVEGTRGRGRVLVWGSTLDLRWTDLPIKPVFLPFVHGALRHLAAYQPAPASLTVGQVLDPGQLAASLAEPVVLQMDREAFPDATATNCCPPTEYVTTPPAMAPPVRNWYRVLPSLAFRAMKSPF